MEPIQNPRLMDEIPWGPPAVRVGLQQKSKTLEQCGSNLPWINIWICLV